MAQTRLDQGRETIFGLVSRVANRILVEPPGERAPRRPSPGDRAPRRTSPGERAQATEPRRPSPGDRAQATEPRDRAHYLCSRPGARDVHMTRARRAGRARVCGRACAYEGIESKTSEPSAANEIAKTIMVAVGPLPLDQHTKNNSHPDTKRNTLEGEGISFEGVCSVDPYRHLQGRLWREAEASITCPADHRAPATAGQYPRVKSE